MSVNNFKAIFTLIVFLIAEVLVSFPVYIPVPSYLRKRFKTWKLVPSMTRIPINYVTAPTGAVLILLAAGCIHGEQIRSGIVGSDGVEPLNVMTLFICLAYMILSVDKAGVLRFLAFWVASRSGSSGIKLYVAIYAFFFGVGAIIGNDPVILSGVPFLAYFTHETGIHPPTAWIFSQFVNANIASAVLVSSNPTNLVLSGAFAISYFVYTAKIILPVLAATLLTLPALLFLFRDPKYIPREMKPISLSPRSALIDPFGGVFGSTILVLTLCTLVATSTLHPQLYQVTVPPAIIVLSRDILYDLRSYPARKEELKVASEGQDNDNMALQKMEKVPNAQVQMVTNEDQNGDITLVGISPSKQGEHDTSSGPVVNRGSATSSRPNEQTTSSKGEAGTAPEAEATKLASPELQKTNSNPLERMLPTVTAILRIMPFSLVLFSFSLFILVQGLGVTGWVDVWAGWWATWVEKTGLVGTVFGMGLVSCILCNIFGTNIGATILLARVLQVWIQTSSPTPSQRLQDGAIYTLALGSNYGAFTFSFPASLAGLLWRKLLLAKGIKVKMGQFARLNLLPCAVAMGVSCTVLIGEIYVIHK